MLSVLFLPFVSFFVNQESFSAIKSQFSMSFDLNFTLPKDAKHPINYLEIKSNDRWSYAGWAKILPKDSKGMLL